MRLRINRKMMSGIAIGDGAIFWAYGYLCGIPVPNPSAPPAGHVMGIVYLPKDHSATGYADTIRHRTTKWIYTVAREFRRTGLNVDAYGHVLLVRMNIEELAKSWWLGVCAPDRYWRQATIEPDLIKTKCMNRNMEAIMVRVCFEIQKLEGEIL